MEALAVIGAESAIPEFAKTGISRRVRAQADSAPAAPALAIYEGGAQTRRTIGWRAPTTFPNDLLNNLTTLRDRSRAAIRNDGYAKGIIDDLVSDIIGTGIVPLSQAVDPEFRKQVQALWLKWTYQSDADGVLEWEGQQAQAVRAWKSGGEVFVRLRARDAKDELPVPLQVQVIEPELCPHDYTRTVPGGSIRAGIQRNGIGKRVSYWFYRQRPESLLDVDQSQLVPLEAERVIHLFDPLRPGQLRGLPILTSVLVTLNELDKYSDASLLRQQLGNMFVGFVTRQPDAAATDPILDPLTGLAQTLDDSGRPMVTLEPGIFQELGPGEGVTFSDPPKIEGGFADFMRQQLRQVAAGVGVPYEVITGDLSQVNDRTVRVILNAFRRRIQAWQHSIVAGQLCRRVWLAWFDAAWISGALDMPGYATNPDQYTAVKWMPQGWQYINPLQDMQANTGLIRAGLKSRSDVISEQGEDAEVVDAQVAADNARADGLGLRYDSDPRYTSQAGLTQARPPGSEIPGDEAGAGA